MVCRHCQSVILDGSKFCTMCGQPTETCYGQQAVNYQPAVFNSAPGYPATPQGYTPGYNGNMGGGVRQNVCPRCGSANLQIVSDTTTTGKEVSGGKACCGYILLGPIGILCGFCGKGKETKTTHSWICTYCGHRWVAR